MQKNKQFQNAFLFSKTPVDVSSVFKHNKNNWIRKISKQWLDTLRLSRCVFFKIKIVACLHNFAEKN